MIRLRLIHENCVVRDAVEACGSPGRRFLLGSFAGRANAETLVGLFILDTSKRSMGLKPMFGMQIPLVWTCAPGRADLSSMLPDNMLHCLLGKALLRRCLLPQHQAVAGASVNLVPLFRLSEPIVREPLGGKRLLAGAVRSTMPTTSTREAPLQRKVAIKEAARRRSLPRRSV